MKRTMPQIRTSMFALANEMEQSNPGWAAQLRQLAEETKRKYHGRRAPNRSAPLTPERIEAIKAYAKKHAQAPLQDIAVLFRTNIGRVSEALFGKRGKA